MARKNAAPKAAGKSKPRKTATKSAAKPASRAAGLGKEQSLGPSLDKVTGAVKSLKAVQASPGAEDAQSKLNAAISSLEDASATLAALCRRARKVIE